MGLYEIKCGKKQLLLQRGRTKALQKRTVLNIYLVCLIDLKADAYLFLNKKGGFNS